MRDCVNVEMREGLPELLHERLAAAERAVLLEHVATCAECAAELELLRGVRGLVGAATPALDVGRVVAALAPSAPVASPPARPVAWGRRLGTVGSLALAAGLGAVVLLREELPTVPPASIAPPTSAATSGVATAPRTSGPTPVRRPDIAAAPSARGQSGELALSETLVDVSDGGLAELIGEIERLDALPDADPDELLPTPTPARPAPGGAR